MIKKGMAVVVFLACILIGNVCFAENWVDIPDHNLQQVDLDSVEYGNFAGDSITKISIRVLNQDGTLFGVIRWWVDSDIEKVLARSSKYYDHGILDMTFEENPLDKRKWLSLSPNDEVTAALNLINNQ